VRQLQPKECRPTGELGPSIGLLVMTSQTFQQILMNFTFGENLANELYNGYELWNNCGKNCDYILLLFGSLDCVSKVVRPTTLL